MRVTVLMLSAVVVWPAGAGAQEDALNRIEQRLERIEQRLDEANTTDAAGAPEAAEVRPPIDNSAVSDERWRFKYHRGAWWYWLPSERWVWWSNGAWVDYQPATYSRLGGVYGYPVYGYGLYYGGHYGYGGHGYGGHGYGGHGYGGHGYGGHGYGGHGYGGHGGYH